MSRGLAHAIREDEEVEDKSQDQRESEDLLTVREVARRFRVDDTTVRRWIKHGTLEAVGLPHVGKRCAYRVKRHVIERLLNQPAVPTED